MPTKLKKPITITIEHVENAVVYLIKNDADIKMRDDRDRRLDAGLKLGHISSQIESGLKAQGIDYRTWEPPQPFKIGSHETTFNPNGSIKVGCTDIDRATLVEVLKRSDEAMLEHSEGEWPKFWKGLTFDVLRGDNPDDLGTYYNKTDSPPEYRSTLSPTAFLYAERENLKPLTRAEACAILGRDV